MIFKTLSLASLLALLLAVGCAPAPENSDSQTETSADEPKPTEKVSDKMAETPVDSETANLTEALGVYMAVSSGFNDLEFTEAELAAMVSGFKKGLAGEMSMEEIAPKMGDIQNFVVGKREAKTARDKEVNIKIAEEYIAELKTNPDVKFTDSGLGYEILEPGDTENLPTIDDAVSVNYVGTLVDGTEFDSATDAENPVTFPLRGVIPGFSEGLQLVGPGGKIKLYIPSDLGYGDNPRPGGAIKAGAMLVFEVDIREVQPATPPQLPTIPPPPPPPADEEGETEETDPAQ